ncbi:hypothetical protein OPV22_033447 [Ensete ventricosum]|uniref:Uncharacterized protein n=1 Tax=Ensete ventricosum TaxID=4639 RepID=A0AAV8P3C3_ENSVE|nr:hypothetical protein OPV22_033447 [Ensete ventricosum]
MSTLNSIFNRASFGTRWSCPVELQEAVASIIFASSRCSDLPELLHIPNLFSTKYVKEFVAAASELQPESNVNRMIIEKLTVTAPPAELKDGLNHMELQAPVIESSTNPSTKNGVFVSSVKEKPDQLQQSPAPSIAGPSLLTNKISSTIADKVDAATSETEAPSVNYRSCSSRSSSDVLEKARAAIAWADRASAAELVKVKQPCQSGNFSQCN